jgi:hypothetical protein
MPGGYTLDQINNMSMDELNAAAGGLGMKPLANVAAQDQAKFDKSTNTINRLDKAGQMAQAWDATGPIGGFEAKHGYGAGFNLNQELVPVKSKELLNTYEGVRDTSPTAAGIRMLQSEVEPFQSQNAALNVGVPRAQFMDELGQMRQHYVQSTPGLSAQNPIPHGTDPAKIPQGAYFTAADGKVYQNRKGAGPAQDDPVFRNQLLQAQKYRGGAQSSLGVTSPLGTARNPYVPRDEASYNALPAGSYYVHSSGDLRRKGGAQ